MAGLHYTYSNDTAATDPTAGKLKFNDADLSAITKFRISLTDADAADRTAAVRQWDNGANPEHRGYILVQKTGVPSDFVLFEVTAARVDNSGWEEFTIAFVQKGGSIANGDSVEVLRAGASSIEGSVTGKSAGLSYDYSSDTANTDPTAGKLKFDNADPTLATALRISNTDGDGNPLAILLAELSASTTLANRATIVLFRESAPGTMLVLSVTGARTDNSGWKSFPVTVLSSNGAFNNLDTLRLLFSLTGDQGADGAPGVGGGGSGIIPSFDMIFDTTTTPPGTPTTGHLGFNNLTLASATLLWASTKDAGGVDFSSVMNAFAATNGGFIILTTATFAVDGGILIFKITPFSFSFTFPSRQEITISTPKLGDFFSPSNGDSIKISFLPPALA